MVIIPERKTVFIHIPRTSGVALSHALEQAFPKAIADIDYHHIHDPASVVRAGYPGWKLFTIVRNPWDIFASHWGWCKRIAANLDSHWVTDDVRRYVLANAKQPMRQAIRNFIDWGTLCKPGGFWTTLCDDDVLAFQYGPDTHNEIGKYLSCEVNSVRENESLYGEFEWDQQSIDAIASHCVHDLDRFGYVPPEAGT